MAKAKKETKKEPKKESKTKAKLPHLAPLVDTHLAAEAAAKRVVAGVATGSAGSNSAARESSSFKQMKDSLSKPAASGLAGLLDKTAGPATRQPNTPFHGGKQTGRNQVFGADVNRTGVPRRTGGG